MFNFFWYNCFQHHIKIEEWECMKVGYKKANMFYMTMAGMYPTFNCNSFVSWLYCIFVADYLIFCYILFFVNTFWNWGMIEVTSEAILYSSIMFSGSGSTVCCLCQRYKVIACCGFGNGFFSYPEPLCTEQENIFLKTERVKKY